MIKKDRIAIVVSIVWMLLMLVISLGTSDIFIFIVFGFFPALLYWAYRFIKNDISFLNSKEK